MRTQPIDAFAAGLGAETRATVHDGSKVGHEKRTQLLFDHYADPDRLRVLAGRIKQHVVENLDTYLPALESKLAGNGVRVHWASTAASACEAVHSILKARGARRLVKAKTMVSEEIGLREYLEARGIESLETDLGEFIVQLDNDHPSHIIKPILHKNRRQIADLFERNGLGAYDDEPGVITQRAREFLRHKYLEADACITGANFMVAETGRMVVVTNEGNARFCLAATPCHIALVGIEKIVPRDADLAVFLNLLARSGTAQQLTVYNEFILGPRGSGQPDGPEEVHVVFVDNGRSEVLASECRDILRCIRCGACLNVCPVYRQASGHAYRSVYPGPVGAVLSPLLLGSRFPEKADLPKASTLCGACNEVCPVDIPIPDLLLRLRDSAFRLGIRSAGTPPMGAWAVMASQPAAWRAALAGGHVLNHIPTRMIPVPALRAWEKSRDLPPWRGGNFRKWLRKRGRPASDASHPSQPNHHG